MTDRFALIVDAAPSALLLVDRAEKIVLVNRAAGKLFGYTPDELVGCNIELLIPPAQRAAHAGHVASFFRNPRARSMGPGRELNALHKNGSEIPVEIGLDPIEATEGTVTLASIVDITERKRHQESLQRSHDELKTLAATFERQVAARTAQLEAAQRHLRTILDALPSMVGYWDTGLINRFANRAYQDWFGVGAATLEGKHMRELVGAELFEQNRPFIEGALRGEPQTFERAIPIPRSSGVRHSLAHYLPDIVDAEVRGFYVLVHDVTELVESREHVARALKEREILLQEIHHRVKNNLQVVTSLLSLQSRRVDAGVAFDALDDCRRRVLVMSLIHEQLYQSKDYAKVRFGDYIRTLASNVFELGRTQQDVRLELDVQDVELDVGLAIPCALVLNELIGNALKHAFRDRAGGTVRVTFSRMGAALRLEVGDDGAGLPEGLDIRQATSMGLQVVATLAGQLDAVLEVESQAGTLFRLSFSDA